MDEDPSATCDARGLLCPLPIIRAAEQIRTIGAGCILEVLATDEAILEDLPAWCRATGHEFIAFRVDRPLFSGYVRRKRV